MNSAILNRLALQLRQAAKSSPALVALVRFLNIGKLRLFGQSRVWNSGLDHEYSFWHRRLSSDPEEMGMRIVKDRKVPPYVGAVIDRCGFSEVRLLDVGCGPAMLGTKWKSVAIGLTATDPLAERYNELIQARLGPTDFRIVPVRAEELCGTFEPESFEIVHASNSIDHSEAPLISLQQMLEVIRPGGAVVCRHARNEGDANAYAGLHQWNFDLEDGKPVIWNPVSRTFPLEHLGRDVRFEGWTEGRMVHWLFFKEPRQGNS